MHADGGPTLENALSISPEDLKHRKVEFLDIRVAHADGGKNIDGAADPKSFRSAVTGRGPLAHGWEKDPATTPLMCAYKLVRAEFRYFGMQVRRGGR